MADDVSRPPVPEGTVTPPVTGDETTIEDERRLGELGYKQELSRGWSGFTNFAISFTIISVLAGPFTNFSCPSQESPYPE